MHNIKSLMDKYSQEKMKYYIEEYLQKITAISEINNSLLNIDESEKDKHQSLIMLITDATKDYYEFLGNLPEDIKKFLLGISKQEAIDDIEFEDAGISINKLNTLDTTALFAIQAIRPKLYTMHLDAISNQLSKLTSQTSLEVDRKKNQPVTASITLNMPEQLKIEGGGVLSIYDKSIINGISSLMESGNTAFSIPMLYHAMTGRPNPTIDKDLYKELSEKIDIMRHMMITIDLKNELVNNNFKDVNGNDRQISISEIEGYLLPLNKLVGKINGKKADIYQIIQPPPLYTYSKIKNQIAIAPITLLNTPVNNTSTTIPLKTYLLQCIELMKIASDLNKSGINKIYYATIYSELEAMEQNKTQKMRIRRYTTTILDYYIQEKYIENYKEFKDGRSVKGVVIEL